MIGVFVHTYRHPGTGLWTRRLGLLLLLAWLLGWPAATMRHALDHLRSEEHSDAPVLPQHVSCPVCAAHASGVGVLPAPVRSLPHVPTVAPPPVAPAPLAPVPETPAAYQVRAPPPAVA